MRTQQDRTIKGYNLHICDAYSCDSDGWPLLEPSHARPESLKTFCVGDKSKAGFCHFFIDDYRFERLWNSPERYVRTLAEYDGAIAPDFSTYTDMPYPMQAWNKYRSMALAQYWQRQGIDVVPVLQWSDEESFAFAFRGIPKNSTVAVSTVGVMRNAGARRLFLRGMEEALRALNPEAIVMYGTALEFDLGPLSGYTTVLHYSNDNHERARKWEEEERRAE